MTCGEKFRILIQHYNSSIELNSGFVLYVFDYQQTTRPPPQIRFNFNPPIWSTSESARHKLTNNPTSSNFLFKFNPPMRPTAESARWAHRRRRTRPPCTICCGARSPRNARAPLNWSANSNASERRCVFISRFLYFRERQNLMPRPSAKLRPARQSVFDAMLCCRNLSSLLC